MPADSPVPADDAVELCVRTVEDAERLAGVRGRRIVATFETDEHVPRFGGAVSRAAGNGALQEVRVRCTYAVRDGDLSDLSRFPWMTHLACDNGSGVTDSGLKRFCEARAPRATVGGGTLPLVHLDIGGPREHPCCAVSDAGLGYIAQVTKLAHLSLHTAIPLTDAGLKHVSMLDSLVHLALGNCGGVTDDGVQELARLCSLAHLELGGSPALSDTAMLYISALATLRTVMVEHCPKVTDAGLRHLSRLHHLERLHIGTDAVACEAPTDAGLAYLPALTSLKDLQIRRFDGVTDRGMRHVSDMSTLRDLGVHGCRGVTNEGVWELSHLRYLVSLDIGGCPGVGDEALRLLARTPAMAAGLQHLNIASTGVTDDGMQHVAQLKALRSVATDGCGGVTAAGLERVAHIGRKDE